MRRRAWAVTILALLATGCFPYGGIIRDQTRAYLKSHPQGLQTLTYQGHHIRYATAGTQGAPLVLLIHGSPGSWEAFAGLLMDTTLTACARVVAPDRPGFGGSDPGIPMPSLREQASLLARVILAEGGGKPAVVLGHSLGGPVAARLAMDHPELVAALVLVAPSIDPDLERTKWIQIPAQWPWVRALLPSALDVCNQEILPLKGQLELMLPRWSALRMPVRVIQGMNDRLVPPGNADFAQRMITGAPLDVTRVAGLNHFIPWSRPDLLRQAVLTCLGGQPPCAP